MSVLLVKHVILYWHVLSGFSVDLQSNHAVAFFHFSIHHIFYLFKSTLHCRISVATENPCWMLTCRQYSWETVMACCSISYSRSPISPFYKLGESVKMLNADMPTIQTWQLLWNTQPWQHGVLSPIHHLVWMFKKNWMLTWRLLWNSQQRQCRVLSPIYSELPVQLTPVSKTQLQFPDEVHFCPETISQLLKKGNHTIWKQCWKGKWKHHCENWFPTTQTYLRQSSITPRDPPTVPLYYIIHALSPLMSLDLACQKLSTETACLARQNMWIIIISKTVFQN